MINPVMFQMLSIYHLIQSSWQLSFGRYYYYSHFIAKEPEAWRADTA